mgnify:CR=1 FL=1
MGFKIGSSKSFAFYATKNQKNYKKTQKRHSYPFKIEQGKFPENLSKLVPHYLDQEYLSPQTGQKLTYSVKNKSWSYEIKGVLHFAAQSYFTLSADDVKITSLPAIDIVGENHKIISLRTE